MPKLTDTQLAILSAAAARDDGAVLPLPDSLKIKGGAVTSVLKNLLNNDLIDEHTAATGVEVWRGSDDGRISLFITDTGLQAISVTPEGEAEAGGADNEPAPQKHSRRAAPSKAATTQEATTPPSARPGTKLALLIDLLRPSTEPPSTRSSRRPAGRRIRCGAPSAAR